MKKSNFWKWVKVKLHCHIYSAPIISRYISFHTREIVYRCRCGKMVALREDFGLSQPFPIETSSVSSEEIQALISGKIEMKDIPFTKEWNIENGITT